MTAPPEQLPARRRRTATAVVAGVAVAAVVSAGVVFAGRDGAAPPAAPPASPAPLAAGARDCGSLTLHQGGVVPAAAVTCLAGALSGGSSARLVVTAPTVEGDPIVTTYLTKAGGHVSVTTDARADTYGGSGTKYFVADCTGLDGSVPAGPIVHFASCTDNAEVPAP